MRKCWIIMTAGGERWCSVQIEKGELTLVKVRHRRLTLQLKLLLGIRLVCIVSLDMVPSIEFVDVVILPEGATAELKGIAPLQVLLWIVRPVRRRLHGLCLLLRDLRCAHLEGGGLLDEALLVGRDGGRQGSLHGARNVLCTLGEAWDGTSSPCAV